MLLHIEKVLSADEVSRCREALSGAAWVDGRVTAGEQSARAKHNLQVPQEAPVSRELGDLILGALGKNPEFVSAALPLRVYPPLFNRYEPEMEFATHVDNAIRFAGPVRYRTDVSATLFLTSPDEYDGGELTIDDSYGTQAVKLPAGDLVIYPATSVHHVTPVTGGERVSSFFWIESMVRDDAQRSLLFDMDMALVRLARDVPDHPSLVALTGCYHNLLRRWGDA